MLFERKPAMMFGYFLILKNKIFFKIQVNSIKFITVFFLSLSTILASDDSEFKHDAPTLETPLLSHVSGARYQGASQRELTVKLSHLNEDLLRSTTASAITSLTVDTEPNREGVSSTEAIPIDKIDFIVTNFPHLLQLKINRFAIIIAGMRKLNRLTALTTLNLWSCDLGDHGTLCITPIMNLVHLNLNANNIGDEGTVLFRSLPHLESLGFLANLMTNEGLRNFSGLTALCELDVSYNKLGYSVSTDSDIGILVYADRRGTDKVSSIAQIRSGVGVRESSLLPISNLTNLTSLDIRGGYSPESGLFNFLVSEDLAVLSTLVNLKTLKLGGGDGPSYAGNIKDIKLHPRPLSGYPRFLESLTQLRTLVAADSGIEDEGLISIGKLSNLVELNLSSRCDYFYSFSYPRRWGTEGREDSEYPDVKINGTGLRHLVTLINLQDLQLNKQPIGDHARYLGNLTALVKLGLKGAMLKESSITTFVNLIHLEILDLSVNAIGNGTRYLSGLSRLKHLDLSNNDFSIGDKEFGHLIGLTTLEYFKLDSRGFLSTLTPNSITNISAFLGNNRKLKSFYLSEAYSSLGAKQREIDRMEELARIPPFDSDDYDSIRMFKKTPVWTQTDVETLQKISPKDVRITVWNRGTTPGCCDSCVIS